jgi:hypothetical protein
MNHDVYRKYLKEYLLEAIQNGGSATRSIYTAVSEIPLPGRFARHRDEKRRAIQDIKDAFEGHMHWPLEMVINYLQVDAAEILKK